MRIVCPACATTYEVPETWLPPGRAVRCARCDADWMPLAATAPIQPAPDWIPPDEVPSDAPEPTEAPAPFPPLANKAPRSALRIPLMAVVNPAPRPEMTALTGWIISLALLAALAWGGVRWRTDVMRAWPPSERLYAALGLAPGQEGRQAPDQ